MGGDGVRMGNDENEGPMISMNNADLNEFGNDFQSMDQNSAASDASGTHVPMPETVPQAVTEPEQGKKIVQFKSYYRNAKNSWNRKL